MMKYFDRKAPLYGVIADLEEERVFDITDPKWAHPEVREGWADCPGTAMLHDPMVPKEEKEKICGELTKVFTSSYMQAKGEVAECNVEKYMVPGCPEEPEKEVEVWVYRPVNLKKKKARCMFYCMGGALCICHPSIFPLEDICERHNCVIVVAIYRYSWEAPYPAAINDLHAAYQWMIENAEKLRINADNVVLCGMSSGGHLATSLAFRLKRYGYSPKGIVAIVPQTDERENDALSHKLYKPDWDAALQRQVMQQWLGKNFGSAQIGPEALANHATIEDCIGYPPTFIHTVEFDPDRDNSREFYGKLLEAKTYAEFHCWGGAGHAGMAFFGGDALAGEENLFSKRINTIIASNIEDCFTYDLRRPWVLEEFNNRK